MTLPTEGIQSIRRPSQENGNQYRCAVCDDSKLSLLVNKPDLPSPPTLSWEELLVLTTNPSQDISVFTANICYTALRSLCKWADAQQGRGTPAERLATDKAEAEANGQ